MAGVRGDAWLERGELAWVPSSHGVTGLTGISLLLWNEKRRMLTEFRDHRL